jgi:hypothetical protein
MHSMKTLMIISNNRIKMSLHNRIKMKANKKIKMSLPLLSNHKTKKSLNKRELKELKKFTK